MEQQDGFGQPRPHRSRRAGRPPRARSAQLARRALLARGRAPPAQPRAERADAGGGRRWPRELAPPVHPSAGAAALGRPPRWPRSPGSSPVAIAIVVVIVLNAGFAFVQERQAERAVEALRGVPAGAGHGGPRRAARSRSTRPRLVPGDVLVDRRRATGSPPTRGSSTARRGRPVGAHRRVGARATGRPSSLDAPAPLLEAARPRLQRHRLHRRRGRGRWSSRPACTPSWAGSPRSPARRAARRARWSARCAGSPG